MIPEFRIFIKKEKRLIPSEDIYQLLFDFNGNNICVTFEDGTDEFYEANEVVLMQSTGRFDKNGNEIFEGDVISVIGELHTVFYDTKKGSFRLNPHDKRWTVDYMSNYAHIDSFEIICNIYENPELVKEATDGEAE